MPQNNKITSCPFSQQISYYFFQKYFLTENRSVSINNNYYLELFGSNAYKSSKYQLAKERTKESYKNWLV